MSNSLDVVLARWDHVQRSLFPWLSEEVERTTELLGRLITFLDVIGLEAFGPEAPRRVGRPRIDAAARAPSSPPPCSACSPPALSLIASAPANRCAVSVVGNDAHGFPSEVVFSRAFTEFAQGHLPDKMHAALINRARRTHHRRDRA